MYAPVAQLAEQFPFKEEVVGSSPTGGTIKTSGLSHLFFSLNSNLDKLSLSQEVFFNKQDKLFFLAYYCVKII